MRRVINLTVLAVFILSSMIAAAACGSDNGGEITPSTTPEATPTQPESTVEEDTNEPIGPNEIQFTNEGVFPKVLTIPAGTTITFYNNDSRENARHWVKALDGSFDTRAIPKHARMDVTFNEKGTFEYQCLFHKDREDEKGTIIVE